MKKSLPLLLITAVSLMIIALYNGYPLTEGDTGAYIQQAIYPHFAQDRPPFYGLFIKFTALWTSLWFPVFAQCLLLAYLLLRYITLVRPSTAAPGNPDFPTTLAIVAAIVSFTCVGWVSAYLMPDIFAGILLLAVLLFLSPQPTRQLCVYGAIIITAIAMHNSHFVIIIIFSVAIGIGAWLRRNTIMVRKSVLLVGMAGVVWATMCTMNAAKHYGFTFSRGKDIFMVAKLAETGILNVYLDENCGKKNLKLCAYKDQIPASLTDFLWEGDSPFNKMGGWDSSTAEYSVIAHDVWTSPRYLKMFAQKSAISTLRQLTQIQAPDKVPPQGKDLQPWKKIRQFFADEFREYNQSLQNTGQLSAASCNIVYYLFFILSSLWLLLRPGMLSAEMKFIYKCLFLFLVINAFVMSTFSTVIYRFGYRVFWVLPATNAIIIIKHYLSCISMPAGPPEAETRAIS